MPIKKNVEGSPTGGGGGGGSRGGSTTGGSRGGSTTSGSAVSKVKTTVKAVTKYPRAVSTQKKLDKSLDKIKSASTPKQKQAAIDKAKVARSKATKAASKFNKANNQRLGK